jgi:hypothetical protein
VWGFENQGNSQKGATDEFIHCDFIYSRISRTTVLEIESSLSFSTSQLYHIQNKNSI